MADVPSNHDCFGRKMRAKRFSDLVGSGFVYFCWIDSADVIGFENGWGKRRHGKYREKGLKKQLGASAKQTRVFYWKTPRLGALPCGTVVPRRSVKSCPLTSRGRPPDWISAFNRLQFSMTCWVLLGMQRLSKHTAGVCAQINGYCWAQTGGFWQSPMQQVATLVQASRHLASSALMVSSAFATGLEAVI